MAKYQFEENGCQGGCPTRVFPFLMFLTPISSGYGSVLVGVEFLPFSKSVLKS
jgi:hypothetical protein